jgi:hypothetical protein
MTRLTPELGFVPPFAEPEVRSDCLSPVRFPERDLVDSELVEHTDQQVARILPGSRVEQCRRVWCHMSVRRHGGGAAISAIGRRR